MSTRLAAPYSQPIPEDVFGPMDDAAASSEAGKVVDTCDLL